MQEINEDLNFREVKLLLPNSNLNYGFHLIRTLWDPYPRVDKVDENSIAYNNDIRTGDFIIEINNESLLGTNIDKILRIVKTSTLELNLKLWNPGLEHPFIDIMSSIVGLLGCPVCASVVAKRPRQCRNGHLLCTGCVVRTTKCPICRAPLRKPANNPEALPGARCLIAEQLTAVFQASGLVTHPSPAVQRPVMSPGEQTATLKRRSNLASKLATFWRGDHKSS